MFEEIYINLSSLNLSSMCLMGFCLVCECLQHCHVVGKYMSVMCLKYFVDFSSNRDQKSRLAALEMELAAARQQGFVLKHSMAENDTATGRRLMAVIGITTEFGHRSHRDSIRKSWMPTGSFCIPIFLMCFIMILILYFCRSIFL